MKRPTHLSVAIAQPDLRPHELPGVDGVCLHRRHAGVHDGDQQVEQDGDGDQVVDEPQDQGGVAGNPLRAPDDLGVAGIKQGPNFKVELYIHLINNNWCYVHHLGSFIYTNSA